jgi:ectoine hydroxylase
MRAGPLNPEQLAQYERDGYLVVKKLFTAEETDLLGRAGREDRELDRHSFGKADGEGGKVRL